MYNLFNIDGFNYGLTKPVQSRWLDIACAVLFFFMFMGQDGVNVHKVAKKEPGQYLAILTEQAW